MKHEQISKPRCVIRSSAASRTLLGMILEMQNKPEEARKQYEEAPALDPRAAVAANNLASQQAEKGDLESAL